MKIWFRSLLSLVCLGAVSPAFCQTSDSAHWGFGGYAETYFAYEPSNSGSGTRPTPFCSMNQTGEVSLNLGMVRGFYSKGAFNANLGFMAGTYANANLASEKRILRNLYEANAGLTLGKTQQMKVDAGVFASHIGIESAIGRDCWNLSRSIMADNSPYYESGGRFTWKNRTDSLLVSALVLTGWQRILPVKGAGGPSFGTQVVYKWRSVTFNYSTFAGSVQPDSGLGFRHFHNLYAIWYPFKRTGITLGADIGKQAFTSADSSGRSSGTWYTAVCMVKHQFTDNWALAGRLEYYSDPDRVLIREMNGNPFTAGGCSVNLDYRLSRNSLVRVEGRWLKSDARVFPSGSEFSDGNFCIFSTVCIDF